MPHDLGKHWKVLKEGQFFIPEHRNDLDELDEHDFRRRYRFYKGTIETLVELLRTKLDSATGRNHALTAAEKVLAAVRFFAFGNRQINVGDLHSISQPSTSRAITDVQGLLQNYDHNISICHKLKIRECW
ncbi:hypothetical protein TNCT_293891 [Trichonephila clavata]|uniref:Nuclease HARBI1 n=1 Tax=Trichonephila clavata TaxID=2740835 RepID=A0A8X6L5E0_TRICU|nr:hypothetical protein TNCT_293891 [Trichonephila clavata]